MAQSPFLGHHAAFLLLGLTDDLFCLPDTRLVDLSTYLDLHLRSVGFSHIALHHPLDGVRVSGPPVAPDPPDSPPPSPPSAAAPGGKALVAGPLGQLNLRAPPPEDPKPARPAAQPKHYPKMTDSELPSFITTFLKGREYRAFVFRDFECLLDFDQRSRRAFYAVLRKMHADSDGTKKIVFVSNSRRMETLRRGNADRHFLSSFSDQFFDGSAVRPNVISIGAPDAGEVLNAQRRLRLRHHLPTNFASLRRQCEQKAAALRAEKDPLRSLLKNNTEALRSSDWLTDRQEEDAMQRLEGLPGRGEVAARIRRDVRFVRDAQAKHRSEHPTPASGDASSAGVDRLLDHADEAPPLQVNLSYALAGNPGTGKTIIARMIAEVFKEEGILRSGHFIEASVQDLVGQYVGQTALKTNSLLSRALGGVLFIDEVQGFEKGNQFHREAIRTILKYVEDYRGDISVMVATYPDRMDQFLSLDEGLSRRFSQRIDLEDYGPSACVRIFRYIADERDISVAPAIEEKLEGLFDAWIHDRTKETAFSNAGSVRNLLEEMDRARSESGGGERPLDVEDVPEKYRGYLAQATRHGGSEEARIEQALEELDGLVGLAEVKRAVHRIVVGVRASRLRGKAANICAGHYSFEGNPGSGKTTVARILGRIFRELGVLKSGHVVEVTRSHLVGQYLGQTAPQVRERTNAAMDGVLFIDEAHNLIQGDRDSFGKEAIGELTAILENERSRLCVIVAGYSGPMARLFAQDPGWKSRFTQRIHFADFNPREMGEILRLMCERQDLTLHADLERNLEPILSRLRAREGEAFSNGRSVRNLLGALHGHLDERLVADHGIDPNQLILEDVPVELLPRRGWQERAPRT